MTQEPGKAQRDDGVSARQLSALTRDEALSLLRSQFPAWQFWIVHRVYSGPVWCTRLQADHKTVLNAASPDDLASGIGELEGAE
jgi:hypothetical protein